MMTIRLSRSRIKEYLLAAVIISSLSLRNFQYLVYLVQIVFLITSVKKALNDSNKWYALTTMFFAAFSGVSVFWAKDSSVVPGTLVSLLQISVICLVITCFLKSLDSIERVIDHIVIAAVVLIVNLLVFTSADEWRSIIFYSNSAYVDVASSAGRLGRSIGMHPNTFGGTVSICLLFVLYRLYGKRQWRYLFLTLILLFLLLLSKSRSSLIEMALGVLLFFVLVQRKTSKRLMRLMMAVLIGLGALWAVMNVPVLYNLVGYRLEGVIRMLTGGKADASASTRMEFIQIGLDIFSDYPLAGVGLNNFSVVAYQDYGTYAQVYAHNTLVEILADLGLVGFISYYSIRAYCLFRLWRLYHRFRYLCSVRQWNLLAFVLMLSCLLMVMDMSHMTYITESYQYAHIIVITATFVLTHGLKARAAALRIHAKEAED